MITFFEKRKVYIFEKGVNRKGVYLNPIAMGLFNLKMGSQDVRIPHSTY